MVPGETFWPAFGARASSVLLLSAVPNPTVPPTWAYTFLVCEQGGRARLVVDPDSRTVPRDGR